MRSRRATLKRRAALTRTRAARTKSPKARARAMGRNIYRPGTARYARLRAAQLRRQAKLAQATATRAKSRNVRARAKRRARAAQRALRDIKRREAYRSELNEADRASFGHLSIEQQRRLLALMREYPDTIPRDLPDPFVGPNRDVLWRLSYSTRAGIRLSKSV